VLAAGRAELELLSGLLICVSCSVPKSTLGYSSISSGGKSVAWGEVGLAMGLSVGLVDGAMFLLSTLSACAFSRYTL
jgi:hypothetical protein